MNFTFLANYLAANSVGEIGKTLFAHRAPDSVGNCVWLRSPTPTLVDPDLPGYRHTHFQVVVRKKETEYAAGFAAFSKVNSLLTFGRQSIDGVFVHFVRPKHEPIVFSSARAGFLEFVVSYEIAYYQA